ncbi:sulfite oxidase-like oxidoreductase [Streptomyces longwoodensis]|uniref:Sulfite oxidase-like oxidoreductase n=1 Tax=Streptomyces lasalocidi TaxID=324833 RepID=A0A4U5WCA1_STRLS|nr:MULTISPECIES: sulfite oxidase-like oxidoreductase [Streptomyces]MCX4999883.1 sulfite oxidase-like oxidoreductase [Streptomyces longwoodensis]TKS99338.1 sulfite oxidase-like oxidoreductase [Streptomyces lasalocidi]WTI48611.1 sulfite oxidase-like oxidoreductase [Streptomyces longwoodensis]WUC61340.1 sulfite oxidase-like oxidoreductase [Streptomyces longwoodensis]WUC74885.1 sulfite oxidase-like oxidoreductase [Streptomyces longwoodensis]
MNVTRGFTGRSRARHPGLPPGQYDAGTDWPVLSAEVTPDLAPEEWTFRVDGLVAEERTWTWAEARALPGSVYEGDIHCVTSWSKFGVRFGGVSLDVFLDAVRPDPAATHAVAYAHTGYTTSLPLADLRGGRAWIAFEYAGAPLPPEHGGPARLLVPHLYFWKSAKWIAGIRLLDHDEPGFWEQNGYHARGNPWEEQRYSGD